MPRLDAPDVASRPVGVHGALVASLTPKALRADTAEPPPGAEMDRTLLERKSVAELREIAATLGLKGFQRRKKAELIDLLLSSASPAEEGDGAGDDGQQEGATPAADAADAAAGDHDHAAQEADTAEGQQDTAARGRARAGRQRGEHEGDRGGQAEARSGGRAGDQEQQPRDGGGQDRQEQARSGDRDQERQARDRKRGRARGEDRGNSNSEGDGDAEVREGVLDLLPEGYGFLRCTGYLAGSQDVYVSQSFVRRFDLRRGDLISGPIRRNRNSDKFPALARVEHVEGELFDPRGEDRERPSFAELVALPPTHRLALAAGPDQVTARLVDLLAPLGRGQRALLLAPPRAGKTTVLKHLAGAMQEADADLELLALLVDERPEEVTAVERSTGAEVVATTFDRAAEDHTQVAELVVERAKRLAERGRDVVVFLDSLTRLVRAYNTVVPSSGRVLPGGVDPAALAPAKRLFAAARDLEGAGSLTIVATVMVDTGSRMDEVIAEGFTDTANMELHLDGSLAQQRRFPAVDVVASGTRGEEDLLSAAELEGSHRLRRQLAGATPEDALERVLAHLEAAPDTAALLARLEKDA